LTFPAAQKFDKMKHQERGHLARNQQPEGDNTMSRKTAAVVAAIIAAKESEVNELIKIAAEKYSVTLPPTGAMRLVEAGRKKGSAYHHSKELLDALDTYHKATAERRLMIAVPHVAASGASRHLQFFCLIRGEYRGKVEYSRYGLAYSMSILLDLPHINDSVRVHGGGQDMVYATHDRMLGLLQDCGFEVKDSYRSSYSVI
jgi:hypothetical protein